MYSCPVYDHFYVKRCNKCQRFHHYKNECKAVKPSCGKCAGEHETDKCETCDKENFVPVCVNCKRDKHKFGHSHTATSRLTVRRFPRRAALRSHLRSVDRFPSRTASWSPQPPTAKIFLKSSAGKELTSSQNLSAHKSAPRKSKLKNQKILKSSVYDSCCAVS